MDTKLLKQKILDLAIRGKLVPQDPNDEPASVLLERIHAERENLIAQGKLKRSKTTTDNQHYENVPFEIPDSWEWVKLDELAQYKKGPFGSSLTKAMFVPNSDNTFKVYEQKNAIQKDATLGNYFISESHFERLKGFEVLPNDIIVSCAGTIGETYIMPTGIKRGIINQALMYIRPFLSVITPFYLIYFDFIIKGDSKTDSKGTAMKNIPPFEILKNYLFPLPPLEEQVRIIQELDKWFGLINEIETSKQDLQGIVKQVKDKILSLAISGKLVSQDPNDEPASELLKRIAPNAIPCDTSHYPNLPTGWSVCRLADIVTYEQPTQYIVGSTDYRKNYKTPVLTAGKSFVLGYTNETNGIYDKLPAIIFDDFTTDSRLVDFPFKVKSSAMKILQVNKGVNIKYVAYFMSITRLVGDTHKRYWISEYSEIPIPLPPINEQNKIVEIIRDIEDKLQAITDEL